MRLPAARALETIQAGKLSSGYLLLGKDIYWRDRICRALREVLGPELGEMGIAEFDLRQDSLSKVLERAQERNLLAPRQLLIVRNAQGLASSRRGETRGETEDRPARGKTAPKRSDEFADYFRDPNPYSTLVLEMMDVDLDSDEWREREKVKSRLEAFGGVCDVVLLAAPSFDEALQLVREEAQARGRTISPEAAEQLVAGLDRNMGYIRMEIEKLCLYSPEKDRIEAEDWKLWSSEAVGNVDLPLTEAIGSGNPKKALEALVGVEQSGKYAPLVILEITRYLRQLILLRENRVRDPRQASNILWGAKLPAPQSSLPHLMQQARNFSGGILLRGLRLAYEAEVALRSSPPDDRIILERFVLELMKPLAPPTAAGSSTPGRRGGAV